MAAETEVRALKQRVSAELLRTPGVNGVGVESDGKGGFVLAVHVDTADHAITRDPPASLRGQPVRFVASGTFRKI